MKQIKTIYKQDAGVFDKTVNEALADGWILTRRTFDNYGFLAEMEREIITESEKCCENCAHFDKRAGEEPCLSCSDDCDKWEPAT